MSFFLLFGPDLMSQVLNESVIVFLMSPIEL